MNIILKYFKNLTMLIGIRWKPLQVFLCVNDSEKPAYHATFQVADTKENSYGFRNPFTIYLQMQ